MLRLQPAQQTFVLASRDTAYTSELKATMRGVFPYAWWLMQDFPGLPKTLSAALSERGYKDLTAVQVAVADPTLAGIDLLVSAQTGSGKTVGFGLAMAADVLDADGRFGRPAAPLAVVIAPTRELALQVRREFDWLFASAGIVTASAVGGMDQRTERRAVERGAHVGVATPGRLRDHTMRGVIDLGDLRTVVLDEADEMLNMGFIQDVENILSHAPADRQTAFFSATMEPAGCCCIRAARVATKLRASSRDITPARQAATYSPKLWPIIASGVTPQPIHNWAKAYSITNSAG